MIHSSLPNLFVIGAPKAGTTTLVYWLRHHPKVFVSTPKEPMYYCAFRSKFSGPDARSLNQQYVADRETYLGLFAKGAEARYRAEGSTDYLGTPGTADRIHADNPNAKIVILLRDPVARAFSEHSHLVRDNMETLSFRDALAAEEERTQARWNTLFRHVGRGFYHDAVRSYLDRFGRENVLIALYDDLQANPVALRKLLFAFLDLADIDVGVPRLNQSGVVKSPLLHDLARGRVLPRQIKTILRKILGRKGISSVQAAVSRRNLQRLEISAEDRIFLTDIFRKDVAALSQLIGKDLEARWLST